MKVFYSWQSDTPSKVGRSFVRDALEIAIEGLDFAEAERPEIDQDTKGILGSPVIADTIFAKIREADVVVSDVTLTGQTPVGKRACNSNVAIELGYALGVHGDAVLLKVMNTHFGSPADLPFDLAHRRWPVQFRLSPEADSAERGRVIGALAKELRRILQQYIAAVRLPLAQKFSPTSSTYNAAAYWDKLDKLGTRDMGDSGQIYLMYPDDKPLIYLRIWPGEPIPPLTVTQLFEQPGTSMAPLCGGVSQWSNDRNRFGRMTYAAAGDTGELLSSTQVLKTGEIWGVNQFLLRERPEHPELPKFIPTAAYESGLRNSLNEYLRVARTHFGYPGRVVVESGLVRVDDYHLAMPDHFFERFWGPLFGDVRVEAEVDADKEESVEAALFKIYQAVFEAAGKRRPSD